MVCTTRPGDLNVAMLTGSQRESKIEVDFQRKDYFEYYNLENFLSNILINFLLQAQKKLQNYIILAWFTNIRKFQLTGVSPKVFHHKIIQISN